GRRARPAAPTPAREPLSRRADDLGADRGGAGRAARACRGAVRAPLRARRPARSVRRGREARRALRARPADRVARRSRGRSAHPRAAAGARDQAIRPVPGRPGDREAGHARGVIEIKVTRLREGAVLPARAYAGDAGLDLSACERHEIAPGERALVGTGLAVAIPDGHAGLVTPRSGLAVEHGITIVNTPGVVDSGYRGELRVILHNTDRRATFVVEPG